MNTLRHILFICLCLCLTRAYSQCGNGTPSFTVNLVGQPTGTYTSPPVVRNDSCCGSTAPDVCVKFTITLDPNAVGINFNIAAGAIPPGALFYQINCGPPIAVGSPICLSGPGPHILTFCKPGNNPNTFAITSIPAPVVPDSVLVRNGCSVTLAVSGFSVPTINWNSVNPGAPGAYNSYLSCTSGCATVLCTPTGTPPPFVDYEVSGFAASPCQANFYRDTVRVYFYNDLLAGINPSVSTICFGQTNAVLTVTANGGLPAYTYSWSTGSTNTVVTVGPGTYTVTVFDKTGCPPTTATAVVNSFTLPITANAGADFTICKSSPTVSLNGIVTNATGGIWSGGAGVFSPTTTILNPSYIPTGGELTAGSVQLYLTTTGNSGCPPDKDTINVNFQNVPIANAGPDFTVCANNNLVSLLGSISGFASTGQWSTMGNGIFTSTTNLTTTYTPGSNDITAGSVNIILTSTGNGVCPPAKDTMKVIITPAPVVNAGVDQTICSTNSVSLNGNVSGPTSTGNWTTTGDGSFNPSPNILNAAYVPGPNDISVGTVTLVLTSTGNGNCIPVRDTLKITIKKLAIVSAGSSQTICSTSSTLALNGTVGGGTTTGIWSTSGTGAFNPGNTSLNNTYFMSISDIASGILNFTLTSTNNGPCPAITDTIKVIITPIATVNAGPNQALCSTTGLIVLNGTIGGAGNTGIWASSGAGIFSPGNTSLNTSYSITAADVLSGSVTFTLSSANNAPCPTVKDTVKVSIKKIAIVNAGTDYTICSNTNNISLNGSVTSGSSTGSWATTGTGNFLPNNTTLNAFYGVSPGDVTSGTVLLILTSTNNGVCPAVSDTTKLTIIKNPTVSIANDTAICSSQNPFMIGANITGGSGNIQWTTSGSGFFSPSNAFNPVSYNMSSGDISNGNVSLSITAINNGPCGNVGSSIYVLIHPTPTASFIPSSYTVNIPNDPVTFNNLSLNANTYYWSFGDGGFTSLFSPTHNYTSVGYFTVTLVATNQFGCSDTAKKVLTVISDIQFPNAFTPNQSGPNGGSYSVGDYSNDVFFPYTSGVTEYNLTIFNRWGELIFESNNINIGWDGYFGGKLCQQDAYVWKADVKFFDGRKYNKTGSVTLLR